MFMNHGSGQLNLSEKAGDPKREFFRIIIPYCDGCHGEVFE